MNSNPSSVKVYTPKQVASMLQLSKNTVYELINRGEIVAKKLVKSTEFRQVLFHLFLPG